MKDIGILSRRTSRLWPSSRKEVVMPSPTIRALLPRFGQLDRATRPGYYTRYNEVELAAAGANWC